jgi:hypothetical protein
MESRRPTDAGQRPDANRSVTSSLAVPPIAIFSLLSEMINISSRLECMLQLYEYSVTEKVCSRQRRRYSALLQANCNIEMGCNQKRNLGVCSLTSASLQNLEVEKSRPRMPLNRLHFGLSFREIEKSNPGRR